MGYLTPPVHALTDFQAEYGGFLMGPGTAYDFQPGLDWLDLPGIRTMDTARDWADGSWSGTDFADVKVLTAGVEITGATAAFQAACVAYVNAFTVTPVDVPFWQKLPGFPIMGMGVRVTKRSLPIDIGFELGTLATAALQFRAVKPAWQSVARMVSLSASGTAGSGMVAPVGSTAGGGTGTLDAGLAGTVPFTSSITNGGNTAAWPTVVVTGPCSGGFSITLAGLTVTYGIDVASGQTVTVDYSAGTATLSDGTDRTYALTARAFTAVPPSGTATVSFVAPSGSAVVTTADMWR